MLPPATRHACCRYYCCAISTLAERHSCRLRADTPLLLCAAWLLARADTHALPLISVLSMTSIHAPGALEMGRL